MIKKSPLRCQLAAAEKKRMRFARPVSRETAAREKAGEPRWSFVLQLGYLNGQETPPKSPSERVKVSQLADAELILLPGSCDGQTRRIRAQQECQLDNHT